MRKSGVIRKVSRPEVRQRNCAFGQTWPAPPGDMELRGVKLGLVWRARRERKPGQSDRGGVWEKRKRVLKPRGIARAGGDGVVGGAQAGGVNAVQVRWWRRRR